MTTVTTKKIIIKIKLEILEILVEYTNYVKKKMLLFLSQTKTIKYFKVSKILLHL